MVTVQSSTRPFICAKGREFTVSYCRIQGNRPGPALALIGGQHGMEHIGPVVLKEMVGELGEMDFGGTVSICACANPLALELDFEFYPEKEDLSVLNDYYYSRFRHGYCPYGMERSKGANYYNMNRLWNRDTIYGVAGEITHWLWQEIIAEADLTVDFHCLQAEKPLIYNWHEESVSLAGCFGASAIYSHAAGDEFSRGNLGYQAGTRGKRAFCVEFSRQHGYRDEYALGRQGIRNVMAALGMTAHDIVLERPTYEVLSSTSVEAEAVGHIHYLKDEYEPVSEGEPIFEISSLESFDVLQQGIAEHNGIVGRRTPMPIARTGEPVLTILEVRKVREAGRYPAGG
jgi:predicted deacylase